MTLKFVPGRSAVKFHHQDDKGMTVAWDLEPSLEGDELVERLRSIVAFMDAQAGKETLPVRTPGAALPGAVPAPEPVVGNGWANVVPPAAPELPADRQGEWELIPPGEQ
ncbi:hypothetical protein [Streptomyces misionensis]|uniref:hypothetical protein n=1 Tax=Streptomyces misionensis TaxID=67331 RepID=UPI003694F4B3